MRSVALGLWVRTGSRNETPAQAGVSHFLEHLLFKGTDALLGDRDLRALRRARRLGQRRHRQGDDPPPRPLPRRAHRGGLRPAGRDAAGADLSRNRLRAPGRARGDRDVRGRAAGPRPRRPRRGRLRRPPARPPRARRGRGDRLDPDPRHRGLPQRPLHRPNIVVGAAGHLDHDADRRARRAARQPAERRRRTAPAAAEPTSAARLCFHEKETEQYHICFGAPGIARDDERRYALAVLDSIFGGSTSSRLFREVREKRGLAYSVGSYNEQYTDSGLVATYVGTREDNVEEACSIIGTELARLRTEPVSGRGADAGQGERQGPPRPLLGVDRGADDADLARDPLRPADRQPRRDAGQGRRGRASTT